MAAMIFKLPPQFGQCSNLWSAQGWKILCRADPSFPLERNSYMLEDSQTALIVTNSRNVELARTSTTNSRALL
jgi:hypothetical protein